MYEYKVESYRNGAYASINPAEIEKQMNTLSKQGWRVISQSYISTEADITDDGILLITYEREKNKIFSVITFTLSLRTDNLSLK